jgi:surface antigen
LIICSLLSIPNQGISKVEQTVKPPTVREEFTYLPIPETKPVPVIHGPILSGWCTSYVASKRKIEWSGNAGMWAVKAASLGYEVSTTPKVGAIYVTSKENSRSCPKCGHVALLEEVRSDGIVVSEMNFIGYGIISKRFISNQKLIDNEAKFIY